MKKPIEIEMQEKLVQESTDPADQQLSELIDKVTKLRQHHVWAGYADRALSLITLAVTLGCAVAATANTNEIEDGAPQITGAIASFATFLVTRFLTGVLMRAHYYDPNIKHADGELRNALTLSIRASMLKTTEDSETDIIAKHGENIDTLIMKLISTKQADGAALPANIHAAKTGYDKFPHERLLPIDYFTSKRIADDDYGLIITQGELVKLAHSLVTTLLAFPTGLFCYGAADYEKRLDKQDEAPTDKQLSQLQDGKDNCRLSYTAFTMYVAGHFAYALGSIAHKQGHKYGPAIVERWKQLMGTSSSDTIADTAAHADTSSQDSGPSLA